MRLRSSAALARSRSAFKVFRRSLRTSSISVMPILDQPIELLELLIGIGDVALQSGHAGIYRVRHFRTPRCQRGQDRGQTLRLKQSFGHVGSRDCRACPSASTGVCRPSFSFGRRSSTHSNDGRHRSSRYRAQRTILTGARGRRCSPIAEACWQPVSVSHC